jgi:hypothetical protein
MTSPFLLIVTQRQSTSIGSIPTQFLALILKTFRRPRNLRLSLVYAITAVVGFLVAD